IGEGEPDPERLATDLADQRVPLLDLSQPVQEDGSDAVRVRDQILVTDHIERRERRRARQGTPSVRRPVRTEVPDHEVLARDHGSERQPARDTLARDQDVRLDALVLDRPRLAAATHAALDLVAHEEDPVAVTQVTQVPEPPLRRQYGAALPEPRLDDERGDLGR